MILIEHGDLVAAITTHGATEIVRDPRGADRARGETKRGGAPR